MTTSHSAAVLEESEVFTPGAPTMPCASLLKPLYLWGSGRMMETQYGVDDEFWQSAAWETVVQSSNSDVEQMWTVDAPGLMRNVKALSGVKWPAAQSFGTVMVAPIEVARAYSAMVESESPDALMLVWLMQRVQKDQQFGVVETLESLGLKEVGVKCGWDLHDRDLYTHAVAFGSVDQGTVVAVATTHTVVSDDVVDEWWDLLEGDEPLTNLHERESGEALRNAIGRSVADLINCIR